MPKTSDDSLNALFREILVEFGEDAEDTEIEHIYLFANPKEFLRKFCALLRADYEETQSLLELMDPQELRKALEDALEGFLNFLDFTEDFIAFLEQEEGEEGGDLPK